MTLVIRVRNGPVVTIGSGHHEGTAGFEHSTHVTDEIVIFVDVLKDLDCADNCEPFRLECSSGHVVEHVGNDIASAFQDCIDDLIRRTKIESMLNTRFAGQVRNKYSGRNSYRVVRASTTDVEELRLRTSGLRNFF